MVICFLQLKSLSTWFYDSGDSRGRFTFPHRNFSTVGSFFTCRWQTYLFLLLLIILRGARNNIYATQRWLTHTMRRPDQMLRAHKFQGDVPKKKTLSQTQSASCVNKYFLLLSDPQLSQKRDFIVFVCVGSFAEWICLTTMSAPHNTVTLHSSNACFYFAIFRSLIYEILFLFLWRNALSFALAIEHV